MNTCVVARAVLTRLKADPSLWTNNAWTSLLAGGASYNLGKPDTLVFPYIVYTIQWSADNNFTGIEGNSTITFNIFDQAAQGTDRLEQLVDRIVGDSMLATGTVKVPTYGFHNHLLVLPANTQNLNSERWSVQDADLQPSDTLQVNTATISFTGRVGNTFTNP